MQVWSCSIVWFCQYINYFINCSSCFYNYDYYVYFILVCIYIIWENKERTANILCFLIIFIILPHQVLSNFRKPRLRQKNEIILHLLHWHVCCFSAKTNKQNKLACARHPAACLFLYHLNVEYLHRKQCFLLLFALLIYIYNCDPTVYYCWEMCQATREYIEQMTETEGE